MSVHMSEKIFLTKQKKEVVITSFIEFSFLLADLLVTHVRIYPTYLKEKKNLTEIQIT